MARYIDADLLIEFLANVRMRLPKESKDFFTRDEMLLNFAQYVNLMATEEVQEVQHGTWEKPTKMFPYWDWKCSVCGCEEYRQQDSNGHYREMKFCPECGAKMDGKEDEE